MANTEFRICSNPSCCEYTSNFLEGNTECLKCMNFEPKIRKEKKRYPKLNKQVFEEKFNDHLARVKEVRERERDNRRKLKASKLFF
jgi:hypothetical protein